MTSRSLCPPKAGTPRHAERLFAADWWPRTCRSAQRHTHCRAQWEGSTCSFRQDQLGGRFGYFLFFPARERARGSPRRQWGGGVFIEIPGGGEGGFSQERGRGGGATEIPTKSGKNKKTQILDVNDGSLFCPPLCRWGLPPVTIMKIR